MNLAIVLGDDHPVVVEGLNHYFESHRIELVAIAKTIEDLGRLALRPSTSAIVTECRLAGHDTIEVLNDLIESGHSLPPIIFFSGDRSLSSIARAAAMSAYEFVDKREDLSVLVRAIVGASTGLAVDDSRPIRQRRVLLTATRGDFSRTAPLTKREVQVLRHVSMGLSNREIGMSLGISVETTKEHVQNILRKLDVNDRTQAAIWALRRELV
jgi:DNA-binding NarL/FixJ family response regulator